MSISSSSTEEEIRSLLVRMFRAAVASADPAKVVGFLPGKPKGRCIVVGAGKASAAMAAAVDAAWPDVELSGVAVTRYGHAVPAGRIEIIEASHPVPDAMSVEAGRRALSAVQTLGAEDLVIALFSGGGSSLLVAPAGDLTLEDKQEVNRRLLASGASISEMNTVRKHLSRVKGGKLARAAHPARVMTFVISDVPGDDPAIIASGPTISDNTTLADAREILGRYSIPLSPRLRTFVNGKDQLAEATPFSSEVHMIATPLMALDAAAEIARQAGFIPLLLGDALEGEAREMGKVLGGIAASVRNKGAPVQPPAVLLSGGEGTVTLHSKSDGRGGRNTEFSLALGAALQGMPNTYAIAADTDGIDGVEDAAGAVITPSTLSRGMSAGLDAHDALARHDSYTYFKTIGDLLVTGPTLTNVNDFRAIVIV
ncbi:MULTISPECIES: glycerate kinase [unclassified Sinorhizobium]|uniref:glycerate kinase type-2 family protein n=1 Tax=unclassified Sinorhizobium TaxID=2613772 RepID=UPI0024C2F280|nr:MULTISPECIES: glycerate kinase [unclassified Sinorhizobium]MDK1376498.1 glycerate kinase [Sinorhizobium sp. 6-70]MDK1481947.1 glycerate kinase [Sinorhizobium sp. 6-117]